MTRRTALLPLTILLLSGCTTVMPPATLGGKAASYGYVPLDPLPVDQVAGADSCASAGATTNGQPSEVRSASIDGSILSKLPDQTIRFAVATVDQSKGSLTFGPATLTAKGGQYKAVLDYIQADAVPVTFYVRRMVEKASGAVGPLGLAEPLSPADRLVNYEAVASDYEAREFELGAGSPDDRATKRRAFLEAELEEFSRRGFQQVTVPIYVGVGLRLSADVLSLEGGLTLAGLSAIGAEAEAKRVTGTLTVQSLGVSGKGIATALPLPSKLDQTTIENAILAVGNMRATLYASSVGSDGVYLQPRVVGLYSPLGSDPLLINAFYSELSRLRPRWKVPCTYRTEGANPSVSPSPST